MADELDTLAKRHGLLGDEAWDTPQCVTDLGDINARLTFTAVKAHEYEETDEVLRLKVKVLAEMVRNSSRMVAYTGAGISVAAGIDDYATKCKESSVTAGERPRVKDWRDAQPTTTHRVLTAMYETDYLKHWIQQNHDSLPQKAGYPQAALNEIHGSLHDPGNPVVAYEGVLRDDLYGWLHEWQEKNDLCLALGTSMSGFNCDSVPEAAGHKFIRGEDNHGGLVIVNLQRTPYDDVCALRIYAKVDVLMPLLAEELGILDAVRPMGSVREFSPAEGSVVCEDVFRVPFDPRTGAPLRAPADDARSQAKACGSPLPAAVWDLRPGRWVRITGGPFQGQKGQVIEKTEGGHYRIKVRGAAHPSFPSAKMKPFSLWLGAWWIESATHGRGLCPGGRVPIVSVEDAPERASEEEAGTAAGTAAAAAAASAEETTGAIDGGHASSLAKYERMLKLGVPHAAVREALVRDGLSAVEAGAIGLPLDGSSAEGLVPAAA